MFENVNITEILVIAALAYAVYVAATSTNSKGDKNILAAALIGIPGLLLMGSADESTSTFGTDPVTDPTTVVSANFSLPEILYVASIGYGAWLLFQSNEYYGAMSAALAAVILLYQANMSPTATL